MDTAVSRFGRIDVLINNAGVFIPKPFTEYTTEDFNALVSTTLAGFLYVSQLAVKQMLRQKTGSIVNISTTFVDQPVAGASAAVQIMTLPCYRDSGLSREWLPGIMGIPARLQNQRPKSPKDSARSPRYG